MQGQTIITTHDVDELFISTVISTHSAARLLEPLEYYR